MRQPETRVEVYAIRVTLLGTSPPVWRRILVPREITLRNLHRALQTVMGWTNSHLHQFVCQRPRLSDPGSRVGSKITNENRTKLGELIGTVGARLFRCLARSAHDRKELDPIPQFRATAKLGEFLGSPVSQARPSRSPRRRAGSARLALRYPAASGPRLSDRPGAAAPSPLQAAYRWR